MSFFQTSKSATFAEAAFAAAGIDFKAARDAGNVNVLKEAIAAASKPSENAVQAEAAISELSAANTKLAEQLVTATAFKADAEKLTALSAAVTAAGFDASKPADLKGAIDAKITSGAVAVVAASGHPSGVQENIAADGSQAKKTVVSNLTGLARVTAALQRDVSGK